MSIKTIFIILVTVIVTYLFMLNFEWMVLKLTPGENGYTLKMYKSVFLVSLAIISFFAGYLGGRLKRSKKVVEKVVYTERPAASNTTTTTNPEDEDYLK